MRRLVAPAAAVAAVALVAGSPAPGGAVDLIERGGLTVGFTAEAGAGYFVTANTNFGAGRLDPNTGVSTGDAEWAESHLKPGLEFAYEAEGVGTFFGAVAAVAAITRGDGDAGGFTSGDEEDVDLEQLFAGWRSGALWEALGEDALEVSVGAQEFRLGDGFLVWDGNLDAGDDAAYWLAPRTAFPFAGLVRLATGPAGGQVFYLRGDEDQGDTELVGVNLDYDAGFGSLGASYLHIVDVDPEFDALVPRDGMQVVSLRANGVYWPGLEDLTLHAEYVEQFGDGATARFDARAFYLEPAYSFSWLPWTPALAYRFAYFSGDPDPADARRADFDPLFYEFSRGWGTWTQGEITGNYLLFNSNQVNHMVHLSASPTESLAIGLLYFHFDLAEENYFGTPVSEKDFADEFDLYLDWTASENLALGAVYGVALPGRAAREVFGDNAAYHLFQVYAILSF